MRPEQSRAARGLGRRSCWLDSSGLPAGKLLLTEPLQVSHDRVDDLPVLLELVCRLDLPILLDQCLGGRGLHQGLSNGWLAAVWLVYILSEGDHRKAEVQAWAEAHRPSLELVSSVAQRLGGRSGTHRLSVGHPRGDARSPVSRSLADAGGESQQWLTHLQ